MELAAPENDGSPRRGRRRGAGFALALGAGALPAHAQCTPGWTPATVGNQIVYGMATHDEDGAGPIPTALYAGLSVTVGTETSWNIGRFDGWKWYTLGPGLGTFDPINIITFAVFDNGDARVPGLGGMVVGGLFDFSGQRRLSRGIASSNGERWNTVTRYARTGTFRPFGWYDENGAAPGGKVLLSSAPTPHFGLPSIPGIAKWDGLSWTLFGAELSGNAGGAGCSLFYDEDDTGPLPPVLFVGGGFLDAGGVRCNNIARWDGAQWSSLGGFGTRSGGVGALCVYDEDGPSGPLPPALFVGGSFRHIGTTNNWWLDTNGGLARWDGTRWSAVAGWDGGNIDDMIVFDDDGPGPNKPSLFVTGVITRVQGMIVNGIARWDGDRWHSMGGMGGIIAQQGGRVLSILDEDGSGPNPGGLYVGGEFYRAGGMLTPGLARWGCPLPPRCEADCDTSTGRGSLDIFDFLCFQTRYEARDPWACDCDISTGARVCDLFDFLCFQNHFANGCP